MGLTTSLHVGRSGLIASQTGIELAGVNLANVATKGYHRQTMGQAPLDGQEVQRGIFIGRGVQIQQIVRHIDESLELRIRSSISDQSGALERHELLGQIESIENELTDNDLSSNLSAFFGAWSELANSPEDQSLRTLVVEQGKSLATFVRGLRGDLVDLRNKVDGAIDDVASTVSDLLGRIEGVNEQIVELEAGGGGASGLRDQRDSLLSELSQHLDISTVEQGSGSVDVFVGSLPIVLNGKSRGVELKREVVNGEVEVSLVIKEDQSELETTKGSLGALVSSREEDLVNAIDTLDRFAQGLIYEVNRIHSEGQGLKGFDSITGTSKVSDPAAALNSDAAGLAFPPSHGSFQVHVTQKSTGQRTTSVIRVDLDGINGVGDTTLQSLAADLDGLSNVSATITADGRLQIGVESGDFEVSFSDDSSGALASLGINTYFTGSDANDIDVSALVDDDPSFLAAGRGHVAGDNRGALALAGLRDEDLEGLDGVSLTEYWSRHVEEYAARTARAGLDEQASSVVRDNLEAQQQSVSGVNSDEEAINLLAFQRAYQGSAKFLSVVDEVMQTLLSLL
jgi:flagellar hook-associated protein 1 FlgK